MGLVLLKLSQKKSGLNRLNSNPVGVHGSKPTSSGRSTFKKKNKLVQMASYHSIASMQCSSPCPNTADIRYPTREEYAAISQPEQLKLQKFFILPQQERHSGHSRLSKSSASFFWGSSPLFLFDNANPL